LPTWCETIDQRALAKTPADRFQSAEEFRDALGRATGPLPAGDYAKTFAVAEGAHSSAALLGPTDTIDLSRPALVSAPAPATVGEPRTRTPFISAPLMVAVSVVVGVAIGYVALRQG